MSLENLLIAGDNLNELSCEHLGVPSLQLCSLAPLHTAKHTGQYTKVKPELEVWPRFVIFVVKHHVAAAFWFKFYRSNQQKNGMKVFFYAVTSTGLKNVKDSVLHVGGEPLCTFIAKSTSTAIFVDPLGSTAGKVGPASKLTGLEHRSPLCTELCT